MLISTEATVKIGSRNLKTYRELGYNCNIHDTIIVPLSILPLGSTAKITVKCDYCNKEFESDYNSYNRNKLKTTIHKDCCKNCQPLKK